MFFFLVDTAYEDAVSTRVQDSQLPRIFTYLRGEKKIVWVFTAANSDLSGLFGGTVSQLLYTGVFTLKAVD